MAATPAGPTHPNEKLMANGRNRAVNIIGYPLHTVVHTLQKSDRGSNAWFNVSFAYDHEEAAHFVQQEWDHIERHWEGTAQELDFLRGFITAFTPAPSRRA